MRLTAVDEVASFNRTIVELKLWYEEDFGLLWLSLLIEPLWN